MPGQFGVVVRQDDGLVRPAADFDRCGGRFDLVGEMMRARVARVGRARFFARRFDIAFFYSLRPA